MSDKSSHSSRGDPHDDRESSPDSEAPALDQATRDYIHMAINLNRIENIPCSPFSTADLARMVRSQFGPGVSLSGAGVAQQKIVKGTHAMGCPCSVCEALRVEQKDTLPEGTKVKISMIQP